MTLDDYNAFCDSLAGTTHVVQWGGSHVWKVGDKVFAVARPIEDDVSVSFKCSEMAFRLLAEQDGLRPAPYLASRGLTWIQRFSHESMDDGALRDYLTEAHRLIGLKLSRAARKRLGLAAGAVANPD